MSRVQIITDSSARFYHKGTIDEYEIAILPNHIQIGDKTYLADIDMDSNDLISRIESGCPLPHVTGPTSEDFREAFLHFSRKTDEICVILHSAQLTDAYQNCLKAREDFIGRMKIHVIDSLTASGALGLLVEKAARDAKRGLPLEEVVARVRKNVPHLYLVFYTDQMQFVHASKLIDKTTMILATMEDMIPLISLEDGRMFLMGKGASFAEANEKLLEFALEFMSIDKICALVARAIPAEALLLLRAAIETEFSHTFFPWLTMDPLMISLLGPRSVGFAILERDEY